MGLQKLDKAPSKVRYFPEEDDIASKLTPDDVDHIYQIFETPLTGSYNWDYNSADTRIRKLYELGKQYNWNVETDLDWSTKFPKDQYPTDPAFNPFIDYPPYQKLSEAEKIRFEWHQLGSSLSQFLHGEQGALLVASQLVCCAPSYDAKLFAASQTFDEARHVEVFNKFLTTQVEIMYPINPNLQSLLDKILMDERWDLKFIGMQVIIESLALTVFKTARYTTKIPLLNEIFRLVIRDEARHVTFGINYLEEYVKTLTDEERDDRAEFALEACFVMRNRLGVSPEVFKEFGWDVEAANEFAEGIKFGQDDFRNILFSRIMPNLKRIGLLTDKIRPKFDEMGLLVYENDEHDGEIQWDKLTRPLFENRVTELAEG
ncbi:MAG: diiron oxygenase [Pseudomonadales bacterium]|nr:diiron oxygenase [Pseudomonadales bacterium]